jgi:hypothetical protein
MASDFCLETLLESKEFGQLDVTEQRQRLTRFVSGWFNQDKPIDVVDNVRWTARIRSHAARSHISVGQVLEIILPIAKQMHADAVYQREAERIQAEDRRIAADLDREAGPTADLTLPAVQSRKAGGRRPVQ